MSSSRWSGPFTAPGWKSSWTSSTTTPGRGTTSDPTLSLRGIDNASYYRLNPEDPRYHVDFTGTGNSLNIMHPRTMALIMDSLRYWVTDMHVDGFRFDLAPVLVRGYEAGHPSAFFEIIQQDPVLSKVKLIAEPWDVGPDGYQLGRFPPGWSEWNGAFRDSIRRFWRGDPGQVPELASRLTGSSDIYAPSGRRTYASVNFVTCHDGFTLTDLVSYERKHNEANGEDNHDGASNNLSRELGGGGAVTLGADRTGPGSDETQLPDHAHVLPGCAHDLGGDEIGRTQNGNNNPYCQDSEISWVNWDVGETGTALRDFTRDLITIVEDNPILRRRDFFTGKPIGDQARDAMWVRPDGEMMTEDDWQDSENRSIGMLLPGPRRRRGRRPRAAGQERHAAVVAERLEPFAVLDPSPARVARTVGGAAVHGEAGREGADRPDLGGEPHRPLEPAPPSQRAPGRVTGLSPRRWPTNRHLGSTYRLQLNGLGFARARQLVPYLDDLGVETLYVSPVTAAAPGSTHGYDVIDPSRLDPALGSIDEFEALLAELDRRDMALLIDIVPNHMAAVAENPWWWDVLRQGQGSEFARYFDIDWAAGNGRVLLPVLGRPLSEVVAHAELAVVDEGGPLTLAYFDHRFPIAPGTDDRLLHALTAVRGGGSYPTMMGELLEHQHYRLALWRLSRHEGNYRRFFDVDGLVGVRVEDPAVYQATHALFLELARDERIAGLRVDHVDGLVDPAGYLARLRQDLDRARGSRPALLVEKVLARDEQLPDQWPVDGTTGYEFADLVGSLLVDADGVIAIARLGAQLDGDHRDFAVR